MTPADERLLAHPRVRPVWQWLTGRFPGVTPDSSPQLDLGIDSLGWVTLTAELAERFGVVLGSAELSRVLTVRDLLAAVAACEPRRDGTHPVPEADDAHRYIEIPGYGHRPLGALVMGCVRLLMMGPYRLQVAGRANLPAHGAFVLAPNHSSYLDPLAVAAALPPSVRRRTCWAGWAGKTHNGALARAASRALRVFPVAADVDLGRPLRLGAEALAAGDILVWFPEGRRSLTGQLQPFRPGLGVLLDRVPVPVVPVRIDGTFAAWPPGRRWPRLRRLSVTFGVPRTPDWMNAHGRGPDAAARIGDVIAREIAGLARTGASRRRTGA